MQTPALPDCSASRADLGFGGLGGFVAFTRPSPGSVQTSRRGREGGRGPGKLPAVASAQPGGT